MNQRALLLLLTVAAIVATGMLMRARGGPVAVSACPQPALHAGVLVCDGQGAPIGSRALLAGQRIDINAADRNTIALAPRVGRSLAQTVVTYREQNGPFASMDEVGAVPGVGPKTLATLKTLFRVASVPRAQPPKSDAKNGVSGAGAGRVP